MVANYVVEDSSCTEQYLACGSSAAKGAAACCEGLSCKDISHGHGSPWFECLQTGPSGSCIPAGRGCGSSVQDPHTSADKCCDKSASCLEEGAGWYECKIPAPAPPPPGSGCQQLNEPCGDFPLAAGGAKTLTCCSNDEEFCSGRSKVDCRKYPDTCVFNQTHRGAHWTCKPNPELKNPLVCDSKSTEIHRGGGLGRFANQGTCKRLSPCGSTGETCNNDGLRKWDRNLRQEVGIAKDELCCGNPKKCQSGRNRCCGNNVYDSQTQPCCDESQGVLGPVPDKAHGSALQYGSALSPGVSYDNGAFGCCKGGEFPYYWDPIAQDNTAQSSMSKYQIFKKSAQSNDFSCDEKDCGLMLAHEFCCPYYRCEEQEITGHEWCSVTEEHNTKNPNSRYMVNDSMRGYGKCFQINSSDEAGKSNIGAIYCDPFYLNPTCKDWASDGTVVPEAVTASIYNDPWDPPSSWNFCKGGTVLANVGKFCHRPNEQPIDESWPF